MSFVWPLFTISLLINPYQALGQSDRLTKRGRATSGSCRVYNSYVSLFQARCHCRRLKNQTGEERGLVGKGEVFFYPTFFLTGVRKSFTTINTIIVKCNITVYCNKMTFENVFPKRRKNKILKNSEHRKCYILRKKEIGN